MAEIVQLMENGVPKYLKTHAKAIEGSAEAFVSKTENEVVAGIKDYKDGLLSKGNSVLTAKSELVVEYNKFTTAGIQSGSIKFVRYGDFIEVLYDFQCKTTIASSGDGVLIALINSNMLPSHAVPTSVSDKRLTVTENGKLVANWGLTAPEWYVGSAFYLAKNKL